MRVIVVGCGVVGASVGYFLARDGAEVTLVDGAAPAAGTTSASFAWLNSNQKTPRSYHDFNVAGMRAHLELRDALGEAPWLNVGGNLVWAGHAGADAEAALAEGVDRLRSWGYAAQWWTARDVLEGLEPGLSFGDPAVRVAYFPDEAWVDAPRLTRQLVSLSVQAGARTRFGVPAVAAETRGTGVTQLRLGDGTTIVADAVVNAAGPYADRIAALFGLPLPLRQSTGVLARIEVRGRPLDRIIHAPMVNARPDGPGHIIAHHGSVDARLAGDGESERRLGGELLERLRAVLPSLRDAALVDTPVGRRPMPVDGLSCLGQVAARPGYYEAVTHSGVTLGPLVGRLLAQEIRTGQPDPLTVPFRADRFSRG